MQRRQKRQGRRDAKSKMTSVSRPKVLGPLRLFAEMRSIHLDEELIPGDIVVWPNGETQLMLKPEDFETVDTSKRKRRILVRVRDPGGKRVARHLAEMKASCVRLIAGEAAVERKLLAARAYAALVEADAGSVSETMRRARHLEALISRSVEPPVTIAQLEKLSVYIPSRLRLGGCV